MRTETLLRMERLWERLTYECWINDVDQCGLNILEATLVNIETKAQTPAHKAEGNSIVFKLVQLNKYLQILLLVLLYTLSHQKDCGYP